MADPVYLEAWPFSEGLAPVRSASNGRWGYVGRSIPPLFGGRSFQEAGAFSDGLALVSDGGEKYYIDVQGQDAFEGVFADARDFSEGLVAVLSGDRWGYIDCKGQMVIPPGFESAGSCSEGLLAVRMKGRWGFIDRKGNWAVKNVHEEVWPFSEGLAAVRKGKKLRFSHFLDYFVYELLMLAALFLHVWKVSGAGCAPHLLNSTDADSP